MAKLVWQIAGQEPVSFALRQERVAVGRDAVNDIRLPEAAVSGRHAVIITRMGQSIVHDLNSSNGSWINGARIESQQLQHGDSLQFGRLSMTFIDESSATAVHQAPGRGSTQRNATVTLNDTSPEATMLPSPPPAPHGASLPQAADAPDLSELDRLMGAIRTYRSSEDEQNAKKQEETLQEWKKVLGYCDALKTRLSNEPRVRYFEISDRRSEVVIRIERNAGQPTQMLMLTRGHMEQRQHAYDGIWLRQTAQADKRYDKCADVMRDVVTTVAHMLA